MRQLIIIFCSLLLVACDRPLMLKREEIFAEGKWVWSNQEFCNDSQSYWEIKENWINMFSDGIQIAKAKIVKRGIIEASSSTGIGGKITGVRLQYVGQEIGDESIYLYDQKFSIKRKRGELLAIPLNAYTRVNNKNKQTAEPEEHTTLIFGRALTYCDIGD